MRVTVTGSLIHGSPAYEVKCRGAGTGGENVLERVNNGGVLL